jgi:hypothetical protein
MAVQTYERNVQSGSSERAGTVALAGERGATIRLSIAASAELRIECRGVPLASIAAVPEPVCLAPPTLSRRATGRGDTWVGISLNPGRSPVPVSG